MTQYIPFNEEDYQDRNIKNSAVLQYLASTAPDRTITFNLDELIAHNSQSYDSGTIYEYREDSINNTYTIRVSDKTVNDIPYPDSGLSYHVVEEISDILTRLFGEVDGDHTAGADSD